MHRLHRLAELTRAEWLVLLQLVPAATVFAIASRRLGLRRLERLLVASEARSQWIPFMSRVPSQDKLFMLADWASRAVAGKQRCLVRSALLYWVLRGRGRSPTLEIGVSMQAGELLSHAWVTLDGTRVGEDPISVSRFKRIVHFGD